MVRYVVLVPLVLVTLAAVAVACGGDGSIFWQDLEKGDCLEYRKITPYVTDLDVVDCDKGDVQVVGNIRLSAPWENEPYPGADSLLTLWEVSCPFGTDDGLFPDESEWRKGQRQLICLAHY